MHFSADAVYSKASILYLILLDSLSLSLAKKLCLLPTPNLSNHRAWSRLHPLLCMISLRSLLSRCLFSFITRGSRMRLFESIFPFSHLVFFFLNLSRSMPLSGCLVQWLLYDSRHSNISAILRGFANWSFRTFTTPLRLSRHLYDLTTLTTSLRPLWPTDITLWCLRCDGGGLHLSGQSRNKAISNDLALWLLAWYLLPFASEICELPLVFCLENADLIESQFILYKPRRYQHDFLKLWTALYSFYNFVSKLYVHMLLWSLIEAGVQIIILIFPFSCTMTLNFNEHILNPRTHARFTQSLIGFHNPIYPPIWIFHHRRTSSSVTRYITHLPTI